MPYFSQPNPHSSVNPSIWISGAFLLAVIVIGCGGTSESGALTTGGGFTGGASRRPSTTDGDSTTPAKTATPEDKSAKSAEAMVVPAPASGLPGNVLYFAEKGASLIDYRYISPNGTNEQLIDSLTENFATYAINPAVENQRLFAYRESEKADYGVFRGSGKDIKSAVAVVPPSYAAISQMQVTPDGESLYFTARKEADGKWQIFKVSTSGGTAEEISEGESFHISQDGTKMVYAKRLSGKGQIFIRALIDKDSERQLTNDKRDNILPQWNKVGNSLVFSSATDSTKHDLYVMDAKGDRRVRITNTPKEDELGATFNDSGTEVAYTARSAGNLSQTGLYRLSIASGARTLVRQSPGIQMGAYWTSTSGRRPGGRLTAGIFRSVMASK